MIHHFLGVRPREFLFSGRISPFRRSDSRCLAARRAINLVVVPTRLPMQGGYFDIP
jgi:hypothetical protein